MSADIEDAVGPGPDRPTPDQIAAQAEQARRDLSRTRRPLAPDTDMRTRQTVPGAEYYLG